MSVQYLNSPNALAATFDMGQDFINPFGKIVIPKGDALVADVPMANHFFELIKLTSRIDLVHVDATTQMTINLNSFIQRSQPDFEWNNKRIDFVTQQMNEVIASGSVIDIEKVCTRDVSTPFLPVDDDVKEVADIFEQVARPLAHEHGGDYELVDMTAKKALFSKSKNVSVVVSVFGACAGCGGFSKTFGSVPAKVNERLSKLSPYKVKDVVPAQSQGALIFGR